MAAARATAPVFDGKPYSAKVLPATVGRSSAVLAGSAALFAACVPGLSDWWSTASLDPGACSVPLLTMAASSALVAAGWSACGTDLHPITAKARGVTPPKSYTFQLLGLSAPLLASAAVASGWQPLPVAGSGVELAHAVLPFALWSIDVRLLRWLNPHVSWSEESVSLPANYAAEHGDSPVGAVLACVGVVAFEVYVQQLLAAPLTLGGCPVLGSASLIALTAGLLNHALANGLLNGLLCAEFYWTVSLMFGLSNSVLPVGIYHHLMYSMPTFVTRYQLAVDEAPSPAVHTLLLHATLAAWHCAAFAAVARLAPPAMPLLPPLDGPSVPAGAAAWAGLACVGLFGFAAASIASDYARGEEAA